MASDPQQEEPESKVSRVKLTARVTLAAYDVITEIQRRHRRRTGRALRIREILDAAIIAYAKEEGIEVEV